MRVSWSIGINELTKTNNYAPKGRDSARITPFLKVDCQIVNSGILQMFFYKMK